MAEGLSVLVMSAVVAADQASSEAVFPRKASPQVAPVALT